MQPFLSSQAVSASLSSRQQPAIGAKTQALLTQASAVQAMLSLHWVSLVQQSAEASWTQVPQPSTTEQLSVVQARPSSQSIARSQCSGAVLCWQWLVASQKSKVVHLPSSQSNEPLQQV